MTATTAAAGRRAFDPDYYLDCRQPERETYEGQGLVRFRRELGSKKPLVFVDDDCTDVLEALQTRLGRWTGARR